MERGTQLIQCGTRPQQYPRVRQQRSLEVAKRRIFGKRDELTTRGIFEKSYLEHNKIPVPVCSNDSREVLDSRNPHTEPVNYSTYVRFA